MVHLYDPHRFRHDRMALLCHCSIQFSELASVHFITKFIIHLIGMSSNVNWRGKEDFPHHKRQCADNRNEQYKPFSEWEVMALEYRDCQCGAADERHQRNGISQPSSMAYCGFTHGAHGH